MILEYTCSYIYDFFLLCFFYGKFGYINFVCVFAEDVFEYIRRQITIGVWERSPDNNRLHFHGIFYIPEGTMPGELIKVNDYNFNTKRRQITNQNTYFNERFGRSDFDEIKDPRRKGDALAYLLKYIEKTGEKIVYSKGLPQFVKSDIREEDIITAMGMEDNKLLLYDDFTCIDEGRLVGVVSPAVLKQLRGCN